MANSGNSGKMKSCSKLYLGAELRRQNLNLYLPIGFTSKAVVDFGINKRTIYDDRSKIVFCFFKH